MNNEDEDNEDNEDNDLITASYVRRWQRGCTRCQEGRVTDGPTDATSYCSFLFFYRMEQFRLASGVILPSSEQRKRTS